MTDVVLDAGPVIHLSQLKLFPLLALFPSLHTSADIWREITRFDLPGKREIEGSKNIRVHKVPEREKRKVKRQVKGYRIQGPDISLLALCRIVNAELLLTDDLELRKAAEALGQESSGSLGVILRAYKKGLLSFQETRQSLGDLFDISTLYLSSKLLDRVLEELSREDEKSLASFCGCFSLVSRRSVFPLSPGLGCGKDRVLHSLRANEHQIFAG
jgi:predicted nucleic acid-binding protein